MQIEFWGELFHIRDHVDPETQREFTYRTQVCVSGPHDANYQVNQFWAVISG